MKTWIFVLSCFAGQAALATDQDSIAIERLSYELSKANAPVEKLESAFAYFELLDRNGSKPKSAAGCLKSIFNADSLGLCGAVSARSGGGTGGVD